MLYPLRSESFLLSLALVIAAAPSALAQVPDFGDLVPITETPQGVSFVRPLDVDDDGDLDLVVGADYTSDLSWMRNDGAGAFEPLKTLVTFDSGFTVYADIIDATMIDVDGTGSTDLVVCEGRTNRVLRLPRTGEASFGAPVSLAQANSTPQQLLTIDIDLDGDEDLLLAGDLGSEGTWLFRNFGFGLAQPNRIGEGGRRIEPADFEGDGDLDLFVADTAGRVHLLRGLPVAQSFTSTFVVAGFFDLDLSAGDTNADGLVDVMVSRRSQVVVDVYVASAAPQFTREQVVLGQHSFTPPVELLDVDSDGDLDIVIPSRRQNEPRIQWVENLGAEFSDAVSNLVDSGGNSQIMTVADLNGDGALDIIGAGDEALLQVAFTGPGGAYETMSPVANGWREIGGALALDADGDGDTDLAVHSNVVGIGVAENDGSGAFSAPEPINGFTNPGNLRVHSAIAADVDDDGRTDILSVTEAARLLYSRQLNVGFDLPQVLGTVSQFAPRTVDLDADGDLDVVAFLTSPMRMLAFFQNDPGTFSAATNVMNLAGVPRTYEFRNMDADSHIDFVAYDEANPGGTNRMVVYFGLGGAMFESPVDVPLPTTGGSPSGQQLFDDLDGDGLIDFIYTRGQGSGAVAWWTRNLGGRQFAPAAMIGIVGESIRNIALSRPVPGGPKTLATVTRSVGFDERYRVWEITPQNTLGAFDQAGLLSPGSNSFFFADLGTGADDLVIVDGLLDRLAVAYNGAWRDVGASYCGPGVPNSSGVSGEITAFGSTDVGRNELDLVASQLPPGSTTFFLASLDAGFAANPGGSEGNLCLGGAVGRLNQAGLVGPANSSGVFRRRVDLTAMPQPTGAVTVLSQSTWRFQAWHRDAVPGQPPISNFTDGFEVQFD